MQPVQRPNQNRARESVLFYVTFPHETRAKLKQYTLLVELRACETSPESRSKNKATRERVDSRSSEGRGSC